MRAIDEIKRRAAAHAQRQCAEQKQRDGGVGAETLSAEDGTDRANQLAPIRHPQQDLFLAQMFDAALKDDQASMEHPMFSLSKTPDLNIRVYEHNGNSITITPSANGLATIWDKDVLLFAISTLIEAQNRGIPTSRNVRLRAHDLLVCCNRGVDGATYDGLVRALERLVGTRIKTDITTGQERTRRGFGLIESGSIVERTSSLPPIRECGRRCVRCE
jgi:plasmid replication initiation protein